ncbi:MAG: glycosyltransferase family 2 protein [Nitrososphaerota archaeon]|nr:glycosyltransferase family 2 protein [Nitrososphaerota archaeon]
MNYWCCVVCRNGSATIGRTLDSILKQTLPPEFVIVVNDGSTDNTVEIVQEKNTSGRIHVIHTSSKTNDIRRIPMLLNLGLKEVAEYPKTEYMMVSGDDNELSPTYAEMIMDRMNEDRKIVVASGDWTSASLRMDQMPHGGGRLVRMSFMKQIGGEYPVAYGWETWLLYKALELGYSVRLYPDQRYVHLRPYRSKNLFGWGRAMYNLGFPLYFVILRFMTNLVYSKNGTQSRRASVAMLAGYLSARLNPASLSGLLIEDVRLKDFVKYHTTSRLARIFWSITNAF